MLGLAQSHARTRSPIRRSLAANNREQRRCQIGHIQAMNSPNRPSPGDVYGPMEAPVTAFRSISPQQAIAIVERGGVSDARRLIVDFAAAGLVKGYALVIETLAAPEDIRTIRGAAISTDLWKRVQMAGLAEDVWRGGTLRLVVDPSKGLPEVSITGVSFSEKSLHRLVEHHGSDAAPIRSTPRSQISTSFPIRFAP